MKATIIPIKKFSLIYFFLLIGLFALQPALADEGNISQTDKYAWSESTGWINFRPTYSGVTVHDTYLAGYAWSGVIGWIKLGNDNGGPYQNTDAGNWGVNMDSDGNLSGYAWSETWGWISFKTPYSQVTIDTEGFFDGYAWSQNVGWIHFKNQTPAYNVRKVNIAPTLTSSNPEMDSLTDDNTDSGILIADILADSVTDVGNGALEGIAIYSLASGNGQWQYSLDDEGIWTPVENASETTALLLGSEDRIRFVPGGLGADHASFSFHAWDQTSGTRGETTDVSVRGNTSAFSTAGDTASLTILVIGISGQVTYYSNGEPIGEVLLTLEHEDSSYTAYTDENGNFIFLDMPGSYLLTPSKTDDPGPAMLTSSDASKIARYALGEQELDEYQLIAADTDENGRINGMDASRLARYSIGLIPAMNDRENHWAFAPGTAIYSELDSDSGSQDFTAVRIGDVSGNYLPGGQQVSARGSTPSAGTEIRVIPGERLSVPIVLNNGTDIEGTDIRIEFDADMLMVADVTLADGILEYENYELTLNTNESGRVAIAVFAAGKNLFTGNGTIMYIDFDVIGTRHGSVLEFTDFQCNEQPVDGGHDSSRESQVSGGFYVNDMIVQHLSLSPGAEYDLNLDGRITLEDAIQALRQGDLEHTIRALRCLAGIK